MSYGIIRIQKFNRAGVKGIEVHDQREREVSHSNKDIDFSRSIDNYDLVNEENINYLEKVDEKIGELDLKKAVRKDAIVMCQCLVTSDKEYFDRIDKEKQEEYFKKSLEFIEEKYGKENIISATVHLDEKTPHMHVNFVPITQDKRLSAKDLFKRNDLIKLHDHFYKEVGKEFGLERGKSTEFVKHLKTEDFKLKTQIEEFEKTKETIKNQDKSNITLKKFDELSYVPETAGLLKKPTGNYIIPKEELIELRNLAKSGIILRDENKELKENFQKKLKRVEELEERLIDYPKLERQNQNIYQTFDKIMEKYLLEHNPNDPKDLLKIKDFYTNSLESVIYNMSKEDKIKFCKSITPSVCGHNMKPQIEKAYGLSTGQIKRTGRGFSR